jgi:hypothetical protein
MAQGERWSSLVDAAGMAGANSADAWACGRAPYCEPRRALCFSAAMVDV